MNNFFKPREFSELKKLLQEYRNDTLFLPSQSILFKIIMDFMFDYVVPNIFKAKSDYVEKTINTIQDFSIFAMEKYISATRTNSKNKMLVEKVGNSLNKQFNLLNDFKMFENDYKLIVDIMEKRLSELRVVLNSVKTTKPCDFCHNDYPEIEINPIYRIDGVRHFLENSQGRNACNTCSSLIRKLMKDEKLLSVEVVGELNAWRKNKGLPRLYKRHKSTGQANEMGDSKFFEEMDAKRSGKFYNEKLMKECRDTSPWYQRTGYDQISTKIDMVTLGNILEKTGCERCEERGNFSKRYIVKDNIKTIGVVSRIPLRCQLGHVVIFHTSTFDDKGSYLLNEMESFGVSCASPGIPQYHLKTALAGEPSLHIQTTRIKSTEFFEFVKKWSKKDMNEIRKNYLLHSIRILVDCRLFYIMSFPKIFKGEEKSEEEEEVEGETEDSNSYRHEDIGDSITYLMKKAGDSDFEWKEKNVELFFRIKQYGFFSRFVFYNEGSGLSAYIFSFLFGKYYYFRGQGDGRYASMGFKSLQASAFFMDSICKTVLFLVSMSKARTNTPREMKFTDITELDKIGEKLYEGNSGNLEGGCTGKCFVTMRDWKLEFSLCNGKRNVNIGIMLGSCTSDRDGKLPVLYFDIMSDKISEGKIMMARFYACSGHGKGTLTKMLEKITRDEKLIEMARSCLDFTFKMYKKSKPYLELLEERKRRGNDPNFREEFQNRTACIAQDVFMNTYSHKKGECTCVEDYGFPCKGETSQPLNLNSPKNRRFDDNMGNALLGFSKVLPVMLENYTTSHAENVNTSLQAYVWKRLDYQKTYEGRIGMKILMLKLGGNVFVSFLMRRGLPICPRTLYLLRKGDQARRKRSIRNKSYVRKMRRVKLKEKLNKMHRKKEGSVSYYSESKEEKLEKLTKFEDIKNMNKKVSMKRNVPKIFNVKSMKTYEQLKMMKRAQTLGLIMMKATICKLCEKDDVEFHVENNENMEKKIEEHFKKKHKRVRKVSNNIESRMIWKEREEMEDE